MQFENVFDDACYTYGLHSLEYGLFLWSEYYCLRKSAFMSLDTITSYTFSDVNNFTVINLILVTFQPSCSRLTIKTMVSVCEIATVALKCEKAKQKNTGIWKTLGLIGLFAHAPSLELFRLSA
jgi:hypothetical protein